MSGLIARTHEDLDELRRRGERNIFAFTLQESKNGQQVGHIQIFLQKVDAKKQRYAITVNADDKSIEKKDKTVGEPVQFYVKGQRSPYEIVVFEVAKDRATGYLTTPKDAGAATPPPKPASKTRFPAFHPRPCSASWNLPPDRAFPIFPYAATIPYLPL